MDSIYSDFAYDDAFRTMVVKCDELLIPFINYMFDMNYSKKAHIYRNANERYLDQQGGSQDKRITDSLIKILNKVSYKQLMKYQDTQKKVGDLMGGKVLDLDIIKAHDAGLEEGREEGRESTLVASIRNMMSKLKLSAEEAMDTLDIPKSERSKYMTKL